jgi:anthranilate synthase/aminodeoxychorismate synthase-like glutamine amidotransferase
LILLLDNYDSFTYNLYQAVRELGAECRVVRNDARAALRLRPDKIILSPGPGRPEDAGVMLELIRKATVPVLGVCLGHQAIALAYGGEVVPAKRLMHGKTCRIRHDGKGVFKGIKQGAEVMRYHSLVARPSAALEATAWADDGTIMGLRHKELPLEGVQFHPESIGTPQGMVMLRNFLYHGAPYGKTR